MRTSLDIHKIKSGDKVKYNDHPDGKGLGLYLGEIYTVDWKNIHSWHTDIYLKEFPGKRFNSVWLDEV